MPIGYIHTLTGGVFHAGVGDGVIPVRELAAPEGAGRQTGNRFDPDGAVTVIYRNGVVLRFIHGARQQKSN